MQEKTPEQMAVSSLDSAMDSVTLVNKLVSEGIHSTQIDNRVWANWKHLDIVMKRENVIEYLAQNEDDVEVVQKKTAIEQAIVDGSTFAPNNTEQ